ncbi:hypothetical protein FACS1894205_3520 [Alphaproteobacteria bacterium]|nr:hypothetical protein FACS1894205_3520 [Alphaproteobacteria bacterium]
MEKTGSIVLVGDSAFAEVAFEYFTYDSPYDVVGFAVERNYRNRDVLLGLPVVDVETAESRFPPDRFGFHVALTYKNLNRVRERLIGVMEGKGYASVSYLSSKAVVWPSAKLGKHHFIFENNLVQPRTTIGDNCVLWSGNHIGHHTQIGNNCFIASHAVVSGFVRIGDHCFVGVNATVANNVTIGDDCIIGAGSLITQKTLPSETVSRPPRSALAPGAKALM